MRQWEGILVHVFHESHFMLSIQIVKVGGQTTAAPYEFEVGLPFLIVEAFKDAPETIDNLVVSIVVRECGD